MISFSPTDETLTLSPNYIMGIVTTERCTQNYSPNIKHFFQLLGKTTIYPKRCFLNFEIETVNKKYIMFLKDNNAIYLIIGD